MSIVYLIVDTRPEVIAAGYHNGIPFYCGSTIESVAVAEQQVLNRMKYHPHLESSQRLAMTEGYYTIRVVATVEGRWARNAMAARMRTWIAREFGNTPPIPRNPKMRSGRSPWQRKAIGKGVRERHKKRSL